MDASQVRIEVGEPIKPGALFEFYKRNNICEAGFGQEVAESVLQYPGVWVAAYNGDELIGFARALHDGLTGDIIEFSLDLRYQDRNEHEIGCFIDSDPHGIAAKMGQALLKELRKKGCTFFSVIVPGIYQHEFYESLGFHLNPGHENFVIDARPYVPGGDDRAAELDAL